MTSIAADSPYTRKRRSTTEAQHLCNRETKRVLTTHQYVDASKIIGCQKDDLPVVSVDSITTRLCRDVLKQVFDHVPKNCADQACLKQTCKLFYVLLTNDMKRKSRINVQLPLIQNVSEFLNVCKDCMSPRVSYHLAMSAARNGIMYNLQYLMTHYVYSKVELVNVFREAVEYGRLEVVQYMAQFDISRSGYETSLVDAAFGGHLHIIQWLVQERGTDILAQNNTAITSAASNGHLEIVQWLAKHGADIYTRGMQVAVCAAYNGHLHILIWLLESGVDILSYENESLAYAAMGGHLSTVQWLIANGFNSQHQLNEAAEEAARCGELTVLECLYASGGTIRIRV